MAPRQNLPFDQLYEIEDEEIDRFIDEEVDELTYIIIDDSSELFELCVNLFNSRNEREEIDFIHIESGILSRVVMNQEMKLPEGWENFDCIDDALVTLVDEVYEYPDPWLLQQIEDDELEDFLREVYANVEVPQWNLDFDGVPYEPPRPQNPLPPSPPPPSPPPPSSPQPSPPQPFPPLTPPQLPSCQPPPSPPSPPSPSPSSSS